MEVVYKFRIYPKKWQEEKINKIFGCTRYVYNHFIAESERQYKETGNLPRIAGQNSLDALIKGAAFLQKVADKDKFVLSMAMYEARNAINRCQLQKRNPKFPRYRKKRDNTQSYHGTKVKLSEQDKVVMLPLLGAVSCRISRPVKGRVQSVTVSKKPSGKYFVHLYCPNVEIEPLPVTGAQIGIDVGLKSYITTSDGDKYSKPGFYEQSEKKIQKLQRQLSRKPKGSNRWEKTRIKLARLEEHIANQRKDFLNKLSIKLIRENDIICVEKLDIVGMSANSPRAKAIYDASWADFLLQLRYKADWYGKKVIEVPRFYASSQICSECGQKNKAVANLNVRQWTCPKCGAIHDRDYNAAKNILKEGLRQLA